MKVLSILPLLVAIAPAAADPPAPIDGDNCVLAADIQSTNHLADIPAALLKRLPRLGDFDAPNAHLVRAFSEGARWVIVYSTSGTANSRRAAVFDLSNDGKAVQIKNTELWRYPGGACQAVDVGFESEPTEHR